MFLCLSALCWIIFSAYIFAPLASMEIFGKICKSLLIKFSIYNLTSTDSLVRCMLGIDTIGIEIDSCPDDDDKRGRWTMKWKWERLSFSSCAAAHVVHCLSPEFLFHSIMFSNHTPQQQKLQKSHPQPKVREHIQHRWRNCCR